MPGPLRPDGHGNLVAMPTISEVQIAPKDHYDSSRAKGAILLEQNIQGIRYYATEEMQTVTVNDLTIRYLMTRRWQR